MTIPEILKALRQWWWILLLCPIIAAGTAYFVSSSMTPIYEAEATMLLEHNIGAGAGADLQSIQAAERRTQTFNQLVNTRSVLAPTIESLDLDISLGELRENVSVSHQRDTQLVSVAVQHEDPDTAALIANEITGQFSTYIREVQAEVSTVGRQGIVDALTEVDDQIAVTQERIDQLESLDGLGALGQTAELAQWQALLTQLEQSRESLQSIRDTLGVVEGGAGSQVFVVEPAVPSSGPVSPRIMLNTALATILGLLLGGGLIVGITILDDNVKTEEGVRELTDRPVIGLIPRGDLPEQFDYMHSGKSISGEIFRGLRTNLQFAMIDRSIKSIVVTSAAPGEGKTTIAANLAIVLAQGGQRVILVDADMRRPRVHTLFNRVRNDRGLGNLLLQPKVALEDMLQRTAINNLLVLATGPLPPNPADLIGSLRMKAIVTLLEEEADIVVFDSPPVAISDSLLLSSLTGGVIFVTLAGKLRKSELVQSMDSLTQTGAPILGVVLNGVRAESTSAHRVYQQYYPIVGSDESLPGPKSRLGRLFNRS
ncbi:MAG: polysaccharide biosynthesis tyrosine autokinase [Sphaerobacteraceae bacterium]|nr:MAG: polysaccharide biosynthesis tyrosine autokinase [Sphaerobacteraceae bacterium]